MTIEHKTVLVTGANRGIGQALVEEAMNRGTKRVYAGTRAPMTHPDPRVTPLILDVTNAAHLLAAVEAVESLDTLINNAGNTSLRNLIETGDGQPNQQEHKDEASAHE
jgi:NAD(P)-dependent dehydrogenase (short-subunit alcohol dehydrogenase family)